MSGWEAPEPRHDPLPSPPPTDPAGTKARAGVGCLSAIGLGSTFIALFLFSSRPSAQQPEGYEFMEGLREIITAAAQVFLFVGVALLLFAAVRVTINARRVNKDA